MRSSHFQMRILPKKYHNQYKSLQRERVTSENAWGEKKSHLNYLKNHSQKTVEVIKMHLTDQALQRTAMREDRNQVTPSCSALARKQIPQSQTGRHTTKSKIWLHARDPHYLKCPWSSSSVFSNSVFVLPRVHSCQLFLLPWSFPNSQVTQLKADREATTLEVSETPWNHTPLKV